MPGADDGFVEPVLSSVPGLRFPLPGGVIHTDFEHGFIKAETVADEDLIRCGSIAAAREKGLYRMEGKEYVVQDGEVMLFKFNV
jgi:ribosome-binding ATPase YchF (GTP1/OBG family)